MLTQYFVSCVHVRFYFSLLLIFTLLAAPFWPLALLIFSPPLWICIFFFLRNSSPLFSITRSSSFSVIQPYLCKHQKITPKKTRTVFVFSFLKSWRPCDFLPTLSCIWVAKPVEWVILHWYACGADGRSVYGHVITKFSPMGRLPHFHSYGASRRAWSSAKNGEGPFGNKHRSRVYSIDDIIYLKSFGQTVRMKGLCHDWEVKEQFSRLPLVRKSIKCSSSLLQL